MCLPVSVCVCLSCSLHIYCPLYVYTHSLLLSLQENQITHEGGLALGASIYSIYVQGRPLLVSVYVSLLLLNSPHSLSGDQLTDYTQVICQRAIWFRKGGTSFPSELPPLHAKFVKSQMLAFLACRGSRTSSNAVRKLPNTLLRLVAEMLWRMYVA
jgi:hypothetical protein